MMRKVPDWKKGLWTVVLCLAVVTTVRAEDTLFVYMRGVDTLLTELHRDSSPIYLNNKPFRGPSLRTNLLWLGTVTPNLGVEVPVGGHVSVGGNVGYKPWDRFLRNDPNAASPRRWRGLVVAPEIRWYPDTVSNGHFFGADLLYMHYNAGNVKFPLGLYKSLRNDYAQGNFYGLGLFWGYSWWLGRHLRLEVEAGAAAGWYSHDTYYVNDRCQNCIVDHGKGVSFIPKLGVNLAYTFGRTKKRTQVDTVIWQPLPVDTVRAVEWTPVLPEVEEWKGVAGQLEKNNPVLRPSSEYRPYTPDMILRKMDGPLYVHFRLDQSELDTYYRGNYEVLDKIVDITRQIMADTTSSVQCIQIVGLASIEGSEKRNQQLSDRRATVLQRYIQEQVRVPDSLFISVGGGEAWTEFRDQVNDLLLEGGEKGLSPAQLQSVLEIIDTEADPARRERRLRSLEGGRVYDNLKESLLYDQRNSGYIRIYYDYVPDATALQINEGIAALREGRWEEALRLLDGVKDDARAAGARAVALWQAGRQEEAMAVLRAAADAGDSAAARYLKEMQQVIEHNRHAGEPIYE